MVDFKGLVKKKREVDSTDLVTLFNSLDRQASHIELRELQERALQKITTRRSEKDLVLKISTGAGKTAIGLLYLQSHMAESNKPVLYMCPTVQLVDQVQEEAKRLGIKTVIYPRNQRYPHFDGTSAKAIILCTYDKLFNALTTFDRQEVSLRPHAIVLDDAHAGVEEIRDAFTLQVPRIDIEDELIRLLDSACISYKSSVWRDVKGKDPTASIEIPYWIWKPLVDQIHDIIDESDKVNKFVWPHLKEILRWCRCVVSGKGIEIIPDVLPVNNITAYNEAEHRLYMSATLADDSVLIRELDCSKEAAKTPIVIETDKGLGERMVLAPSLAGCNDLDWLMGLCATWSKRYNIVVLTHSESRAKTWEKFGAKVAIRDEVQGVVKDLKGTKPSNRFVVFVQRYDGVDLPDDACRILVLDGMPVGEGIIDRHDSSLVTVPGGMRNRIIYRIEQGMGRAIRSHADYCVIMLAGAEIAHFVAKHDVLNSMNSDTRAQLRLALDLMRLAEDEEKDPETVISEMIKQSLTRDDGWKQFYAQSMEEIGKDESDQADEASLVMAEVERDAYKLSLTNDFLGASKKLEDAAHQRDIKEKDAGYFLQKAAGYLYEVDTGKALEIQRGAHKNNYSLFCPPGIIPRPPKIEKFDSLSQFVGWFAQFDNPNGAIAKLFELRAQLSYGNSHNVFENALKELAPIIGAVGLRPEKELNEGPDVLWLWPDIGAVIEAKNEVQSMLHKKDAGQLLTSIEWFKKNYENRGEPIPIVPTKTPKVDNIAYFPKETRVIIPGLMTTLLDNCLQFLQAIIGNPTIKNDVNKMEALRRSNNLTPSDFVKNYTVELEGPS